MSCTCSKFTTPGLSIQLIVLHLKAMTTICMAGLKLSRSGCIPHKMGFYLTQSCQEVNSSSRVTHFVSFDRIPSRPLNQPVLQPIRYHFTPLRVSVFADTTAFKKYR